MVQFNIGVFLVAHFGNNFAPHTAAAQHVGFINAGYLAAAFASRFKGKTGNALYFRAGVHFNVACFFHAVGVKMCFVVRAKVNAAGQFAYN